MNDAPITRRSFAVALPILAAGCMAPLGVQAQTTSRLPSSSATPAVEAPPGIKTFSKIPRSGTEVASAHLKSQFQVVDFLPRGEPLEISSFTPILTPRDKGEKHAKTPNPSTRRPIFSVGIEVAAEDRPKLPQLSSATILAYLDNHYVSLQARIQKEAKTGELYLHQRPIAMTAKFGPVRLTEDFTPAVAQSVREMRSLGLYLPAKSDPTPDNLRTLFLVHKHNAADDKGGSTPRYEFIIVRGKPNLGGSRLDMHCFATSGDRSEIHYLKPQRAPGRYNDCTLRASVYFSRYTDSIVPAESVVRSQSIESQASFTSLQLDGYVKHVLKVSGNCWDHINDVLDAIIDRKLRPAPANASAKKE
jgi:hypothetical protein